MVKPMRAACLHLFSPVQRTPTGHDIRCSSWLGATDRLRDSDVVHPGGDGSVLVSPQAKLANMSTVVSRRFRENAWDAITCRRISSSPYELGSE